LTEVNTILLTGRGVEVDLRRVEIHIELELGCLGTGVALGSNADGAFDLVALVAREFAPGFSRAFAAVARAGLAILARLTAILTANGRTGTTIRRTVLASFSFTILAAIFAANRWADPTIARAVLAGFTSLATVFTANGRTGTAVLRAILASFPLIILTAVFAANGRTDIAVLRAVIAILVAFARSISTHRIAVAVGRAGVTGLAEVTFVIGAAVAAILRTTGTVLIVAALLVGATWVAILRANGAVFQRITFPVTARLVLTIGIDLSGRAKITISVSCNATAPGRAIIVGLSVVGGRRQTEGLAGIVGEGAAIVVGHSIDRHPVYAQNDLVPIIAIGKIEVGVDVVDIDSTIEFLVQLLAKEQMTFARNDDAVVREDLVMVDAVICEQPAVEVDLLIAGIVKFEPLANHIVDHVRVLHYLGDYDGSGFRCLRLNIALFIAAIVGGGVAVVALFVEGIVQDAIAAVGIAVGAILGAGIAILIAIAEFVAALTHAVIRAGLAILFVTAKVIPTLANTIRRAGIARFVAIAGLIAALAFAVVRARLAILVLCTLPIATRVRTFATIIRARLAIFVVAANFIGTAIATITRAGGAIFVGATNVIATLRQTLAAILRAVVTGLVRSALTVAAETIAAILRASLTTLLIGSANAVATQRWSDLEFGVEPIQVGLRHIRYVLG